MAADNQPDKGAEDKAGPSNVGPDGEKIKDMSYYELLGVRGDATELDLKKAYRKGAIKYHPDKNPGNVEAEQKFIAIGEAFQILSDPQERAYYNKNGKRDRSQPGNEMEDPGKVFATMFGGEKFKEWIGEISLGKDIGKAFEVSTTEEERDQMKKDWQESQKQTQPGMSSIAAEKEKEAPGGATPSSTAGAAPGGTSTPNTSDHKPASDEKTAAPGGATSPSGVTSPGSAATPSGATSPGSSASKPGKMTPEQRAEMDKYEEGRRQEQHERVLALTKTLKDRLRPFVEANEQPTHGDGAKVEVERWEKMIRTEAEDLKLESFGIELLRLIGSVYFSKATTYLKLHGSKSIFANFLGLPSFFASTRAKGKLIKEAWGMVTTTMDVTSAMQEMERRQEKGEVPEDEMEQLNKDLMGKLLLISWKGTRFESGAVLRQVVDNVLTKEAGVSDTTLLWRAKGLVVIGAIFKAVEPDESDEERRELEKLVADAARKKKNPKSKGPHAPHPPGATPAGHAHPAAAHQAEH